MGYYGTAGQSDATEATQQDEAALLHTRSAPTDTASNFSKLRAKPQQGRTREVCRTSQHDVAATC